MLPFIWTLFQNNSPILPCSSNFRKSFFERMLVLTKEQRRKAAQKAAAEPSALPCPDAETGQSRGQAAYQKEGSAYPLIMLPLWEVVANLLKLGCSITQYDGFFKRTFFKKPLIFEKTVKKISVW